MEIFTLGCQGHSLATYVAILEQAAIDLVIDVRETPWSYKPGFSKNRCQWVLSTQESDIST